MSPLSPLPQRSRLIHIGPYKTGSTGIQWALHVSRQELEDQGVVYASGARHNAAAARHLTGVFHPGMDREVAEQRYARLVDKLTENTERRRVYSSEYLCNADEEQIGTLLTDIGADQTYVVVTLRPLAKILPSQYQQYLQNGRTFEYEPWLESILNEPAYSPPSPNFWRRHRHDELVERWAKVAGKDRVIVVMLDGSDFSVGPRAFESLLGLRSGTLVDKEVPTNRSMTWGETELLRAFNIQAEQAGLESSLYRELVDFTMARVKERRPESAEPKIASPAWAVEKANQIGAEMAERIHATGVPIMGDLSLMSTVTTPSTDPTPPTTAEVDVAAHFAMGFALLSQQLAKADGRKGKGRKAGPPGTESQGG